MDTAEKDIELLAKLLNDRKKQEAGKMRKLYDGLYAHFEKTFLPGIEDVSFPRKDRIMQELDEALDDMELGVFFPELPGRTLLGVTGKSAMQAEFRELWAMEAAELLEMNRTLPCFVSAKEWQGEIGALNTAGERCVLSAEEYERFNGALGQQGIDSQQILQAYATGGAKGMFKNTVFVWLPEDVNWETPFNRCLLRSLDAVVLGNEVAGKKLQPLYEVCDREGVRLLVLSESAQQDAALLENTAAEFLSGGQLIPRLQQMDRPRHTCLFSTEMESSRLSFLAYYKEQEGGLKAELKQFSGDLGEIEQDSTRERMQGYRAEIASEIESLAEEKKKITALFKEFCKQAQDFESLLLNAGQKVKSSAGARKMQPRERCLRLWGRMTEKCLAAHLYAKADDYIKVLEKHDYAYAYIYRLRLWQEKGRPPKAHFNARIRRLQDEPNNELVRRAKIYFADELGLRAPEFAAMAQQLPYLETAAEYYYRALFAEMQGRQKEAADHYKKAYNKGYAAAGEKLLEFAQSGIGGFSLAEAAEYMLPEACYRYGLQKRKAGEGNEAAVSLKIAAAKEYLPAIGFLADELYEQIAMEQHTVCEKAAEKPPILNALEAIYKIKRTIEPEEETGKNKILNCLALFQYLLRRETEESVRERQEKVGFLYAWLGDVQRALGMWREAKTAEAWYQCGCLYQNGAGSIAENLDEAAYCFLEAGKRGHGLAKAAYSQVCAEQERRKAEKAYDKNKKYESTKTIENYESDEGCFIATATCTALQKKHNCRELMAMHVLHKVLERDSGVKKLIEEYYRIAPEIVRKIDADQSAAEEYRSLWSNCIEKTYGLIRERRYGEATLAYIDMVEGLSRKYHVPLAAGIEEEIAGFRARYEKGLALQA